ncbi:MAG: hypothetical protein WC360_02050 [Opitutales bacterium]|jgi:hypothetical protein
MTLRITTRLLLLPLLCLGAFHAPAQTADPKPDAFAVWTGPAHPWPKGSLPALQLKGFWEQIESQKLMRYGAEGSGLRIVFSAVGPFRLMEPEMMPPAFSNALVLEDSRSASAYMAITMFRSGDFFPELNLDALSGYAKALVLGGGQGAARTEIVEAPSQGSRKLLLMGMSPLGLTWKSFDARLQVPTLRTDYFFETPKGLLVVSIVAEVAIQPGVRSAAEDILRHAVIETD